MEILLWLVPAGVATTLAMVWAAWAGRPEREVRDRDDAAYERFSRAIDRAHPAAGKPRPQTPRDRSTGIAVRPSRPTAHGSVPASAASPGRPGSRVSAAAPGVRRA